MKQITAKQFGESLISGSNQMINNKERIDAMNVFPVPDGDTGSNMGSTIEYASNEIKGLEIDKISDLTEKFSKGMLMGARGNSGVILSQIFKGISVGLSGKTTATQFDFVSAFEKASEYAYRSVMQPVEGTILTVVRMVSEKLSTTITANNSIEDVFKVAAEAAKDACIQTPNFLPVLKEVGVTDSGGEGLLMVLEGINSALKGKPVERTEQAQIDITQSFIGDTEDFSGEFGYCTEFIVELKSFKAFKKEKFQQALEKMGNSIVAVQDNELLKVHIHVVKPGMVLNFAQKFGEFLKIKSDNMTLQANESHKAKTNSKTTEKVNIGIISCNTGSGIIDEMEKIGADFILQAGQSSNPSAKDFMDAIESIDTDKIIILPNNSNIILAAQQVVQTTKKQVVVIPTKTQMEGIVAMLNFDREGEFNEVREAMEESLNEVKTGQVTTAVKTTKIEGVQVKKGEFLSISERKIIGSTPSKTKAAINICKNLITEDTELVTIFFGQDETKIDAQEIASYIETNTNVEVEVKNGAQPTYNFLMAFE